MSERGGDERDEFEGWPQPAWAGEPDDPPRAPRAPYAGDDDEVDEPGGDDPSDEPEELEPEGMEPDEAEPVAAAVPEPEQPAEPEPVSSEPPADEPDEPDEPEPDESDELDLSAEHHDDEQWAEAGMEGEASVAAAEQPGLEHAGGELDIPPGYVVLEGEPVGERRAVGIVVSRFNGGITNRMLETALDALADAGVPQDAVTVMPVPGAFELPLAAMALAKTRRYACIVALGAVIRGGTPHFEYVATEAASGLQLAQIETGVPVAFGVLTCDNVEQAEARIYKAAEAVQSALEMADVFAKLRATAKTA